MPRVQTLSDHLTSGELLARYRAAEDRVERTHWQLLYLKSVGKPTSEIGLAVGYSKNWVLKLVRRYNKEGAAAVPDRRHEHAGSTPMLTSEQQAELARALESGRTPDGALWNGPRVARWIEEKTGRAHVHDQRGWDYLVRLGFSAQTPRPRHQGGKAEEQEAFKKQAPHTRDRAPER